MRELRARLQREDLEKPEGQARVREISSLPLNQEDIGRLSRLRR